MSKNLHVTTANPSTMSRADKDHAFKWLGDTVGAGCRFHRTDDELPTAEYVKAWAKRTGRGKFKVCQSPHSGKVLAIYWLKHRDFEFFEETLFGAYDAIVVA